MSIDRHAFRTRAFADLVTRTDRVLGPEAKSLEPLHIHTLYDLLRHVPRRYFKGTELSDMGELQVGEEVAVKARVRRSDVARSADGRERLEATVTDGAGHDMRLTFFGHRRPPRRRTPSGESAREARDREPADWVVKYWHDLLRPGRDGIFVGKVGEFRGQLQLAHPAFVVWDERGELLGSERNRSVVDMSRGDLVAIYPATAKHPTWLVAADVKMVLDHLTGLRDPMPGWIAERADLVDLYTAFTDVHQPRDLESVERGLHRLRFDEVFALQLAMARRRAEAAVNPATPRPRVTGGLLDAFDARLPFRLTDGQLRVGEEIFADLAREHPMHRLLSGEVGSGKTVVALRAMLAIVDGGGQAALLAPTEVLAQQHHASITAMLGDLAHGNTLMSEVGTQVVLLTGATPAARRRSALAAIASGQAGIVIGTHALLTESVEFADLGLVVVDEQHRFGVEQRALLSDRAGARGSRPHLLAMTATPIPRTVALTFFGDLETSTLTEVPAGRSAVSTVVVDELTQPAWVERAWQRIREEVAAGRQAFVVCARIDPDEKPEPGQQPVTGVIELYDRLATGPLAGLRLGMLHGRMSADEKEAAMTAFATGRLDVLVATTVIEVGVDVPNATVMVVSDADRFGISQLHQLRGRIGRGEHPGVCLLFTRSTTSTARERLAAVAATRDGFALAELDLAQRREGDILGAQQSGAANSLRFLRVLTDGELIRQAHDLAVEALERDPELTDPGLADQVRLVELDAAGEWLERA